ncbi:DUF4112 domain-containing protein [Amaricoccus macauensis]|uniref:DUF4112 domain-containing protein n=1 Tax=Amaricoccus macauensis TaxID=57001 RepID=UPI003C7CA52B
MKIREEIEQLERMAKLLDARFVIPFTGIRFGLDGLLGLVPVVGDTAALAPSLYVVYRAHRLGVRRSVLLRMMGNTAADYAIGIVPVFGDILDVAFKANRRNVALLREELLSHGDVIDAKPQSMDGTIRRPG